MAGWPRPLRAELFLQDECVLGEGPFWFEGRLYWVDIERGLLRSVDRRGGDRRSHSVGRRLGAAAPIDGQRFVVAVQDGIGILDTEAGSVSILASPEASLPGSRFNDGKCDPAPGASWRERWTWTARSARRVCTRSTAAVACAGSSTV